jgi:hypothetical protein
LDDATQSEPWKIVPIEAGDLWLLTGHPPSFDGMLDIEVRLNSGGRFVGTVGTLLDVTSAMDRWAGTGECLAGRYFWAKDLVIVRDKRPTTIAAVIADLIERHELPNALSEGADD